MPQHTPLNSTHRESGARLVDFAGWELPLHFGSQLEEHRAVRQDAGMFDVSHMSLFDLEGPGAMGLLRTLLANDAARLVPGQGLYTCLLNPDGGILDDAILFRAQPERFRLVANASTRAKIAAGLDRAAQGQHVMVTPRFELAMLAVQGPAARGKCAACLPPALAAAAQALPPFGYAEADGWGIARTGYTGEEGYEIMLPPDAAPALWRALAAAGVRPCGLGARDSLRLEAGLRLYGADMDESVTPLECGLGWTVAFAPEDRDFVGRAALERQRQAGGLPRFAGLVLEEPGVMRHGQRVQVEGAGAGIITSGGFSPSLGRSVAFAKLPPGSQEHALVEIRGQWKRARITRPRFLAGQGARTP
jgi:aminomethyltransferase